ncbi:MAG: hypothetical protein KF901_07785 [Myxococcales bacterium]|nr:hypothetical protein [Myxococcales bacterium]
MRASLTLVALALTGCTILNAPDPGLLEQDGGVDAGDGGDPDASDASDASDAGDADPPDARPREICNNGVDDDGDGLVDCEDFDCASDPDANCCVPDVVVPPLVDQGPWPMDLARWQPALETRRPLVEGGRITRFEGIDPFAIVYDECVPLALGARVRASFRALGPTPAAMCDGDGRCDALAALVLSPVDTQRVGRRLLDELAITFHASGRVEITQAGALVAEPVALAPSPAQDYSVDLTLTADVDAAGRAALAASLRVTLTGTTLLEWRGTILEQRNLVTEPGAPCEAVPGLYLAVEGRGVGVEVGPGFRVDPLDCTNPSQFTREGRPLTAGEVLGTPTASLGFDEPPHEAPRQPRWASEALRSSALLAHPCVSPAPTSSACWHVLVEATNDQPELSTTARVGWSIGYAQELENDASWSRVRWRHGREDPWFGPAPASCLDGSCTPSAAAREPHAFALRAAGSTVPAVVFARERMTSERFDLHYRRLDGFSDSALVHAAADEPDCDSLRDPAVAPRVVDLDAPEPDDYWLFFTCMKDGARSTLRAIAARRIDGFEVVPGARSVEVLTSDDLGLFARDGVRSPEPIFDAYVEPTPDGPVTRYVYRLWFLGLDDVAGASVGVAVGQQAVDGELPRFVPYPANPILTRLDRAFEDCAGCTLDGVSVARHGASPDRLRFLVTRRVPMPAMGRRFELVALDQPWRVGR